MRTVKLKITSTETWYPEVEVPDHVKTDDEILEFISDNDSVCTDNIYDSCSWRNTCDYDTETEVVGDRNDGC